MLLTALVIPAYLSAATPAAPLAFIPPPSCSCSLVFSTQIGLVISVTMAPASAAHTKFCSGESGTWRTGPDDELPMPTPGSDLN